MALLQQVFTQSIIIISNNNINKIIIIISNNNINKIIITVPSYNCSNDDTFNKRGKISYLYLYIYITDNNTKYGELMNCTGRESRRGYTTLRL